MPAANIPLERAGAARWRIPKSHASFMRVDGMVYASDSMIQDILKDESLVQVVNVACLPGIVGHSMAMPDIHFGYGFPIGGVAATRVEDGVISPGGVGYDINCGVRCLTTGLTKEEVGERMNDLVNQLFRDVPSGVGSEGRVRVSEKELEEVMVKGARWAVAKGMGTKQDLERTEAGGSLPGADPSKVFSKARKRGLPQLGTLGAGNHFLEIEAVEEIYEPDIGQAMGILHPGQVVIMIHTGSRGFGYQVCDDYLEVMQRAVEKYHIELPDKQLACAPIQSGEGQDYLAAMACAANYAWANRQCIAHWVREACEQVFHKGADALGINMVYDVAHNIAKIEKHVVEGEETEVCVHRKGATRAFPPGHPEIPEIYRKYGQPVLIPGDMGRASYVLVGTEGAMSDTFGSTCHGAGRRLSRSAALRQIRGDEVIARLKKEGILVRSASKKTVAEEVPEAYKDVSQVVDATHTAGISLKVARTRPMGVVKG